MGGARAQGYTEEEESIFRWLLRAEIDFLQNARHGNWHAKRNSAKEGAPERRDVHAKARVVLGNIPGLPASVRELTLSRYLGWLRASGLDAKFERYM